MSSYQVLQDSQGRLYLALNARQPEHYYHLPEIEQDISKDTRGVIVIDMFNSDEEVYEL